MKSEDGLDDALLEEAIKLGEKIGTFSTPAVALAKQALRKYVLSTKFSFLSSRT